jgi:hypothetical protein
MSKSQGEIFGIALMFVIIIIGIIVYVQIKALQPERTQDLQNQGEYERLAEGSLDSVLELSTGCYIQRGSDSIRDLMNYCLAYSFNGDDPEIECFDVRSKDMHKACAYSKELLEKNLDVIFSSNGVGKIPYQLNIEVPANQDSLLNLPTPITNIEADNSQTQDIEGFKVRDTPLTKDNYRELGYKKAPSGLKTWSSAQSNVNMELYLYYR